MDGRLTLNLAAAPADHLCVPRVALTILILLAIGAAAPAGADAALRRCGKTADVRSLTASGASCASARRLARRVGAARHDRERYARTRRCAGDFCIVVLGWRCRPAPGVAPRERCTSRRRAISWIWR